MEIHVAICDDEIFVQNKIEKMINDWFQDNLIKGSVVKFQTEEEAFREEYDLIFLDIELGKNDGIQIKNRLLREKKDTLIVFISSHQERMPEAFGRNVLGFVKKPIEEKDIRNFLQDAINEVNIIHRRLFVRQKESIVPLLEKNVTYIESVEKYSYVHCIDGNKFFSDKSLAQWESELSSAFFVRCHKKYIVCMWNINRIENESICFSNMEHILCSRRRKQVTKEKFYDFIVRYAR